MGLFVIVSIYIPSYWNFVSFEGYLEGLHGIILRYRARPISFVLGDFNAKSAIYSPVANTRASVLANWEVGLDFRLFNQEQWPACAFDWKKIHCRPLLSESCSRVIGLGLESYEGSGDFFPIIFHVKKYKIIINLIY